MTKTRIHPILQKRFGDRLKEERLRLRLSQEAFARLLGISRVMVTSLENGIRGPSLGMVEVIAKKLGKDPGWFLQP